MDMVDNVLHVSSQLIDDKKLLSEWCEQLVKEMKEMDSKYKHKIKTMEEGGWSNRKVGIVPISGWDRVLFNRM